MASTDAGLARARELRQRSDALAAMAQGIIARTEYANARAGNAARMMAMLVAKERDIPGDNSEFFGLIEDFYMDITVDAEVGPRVLTLVNDERDTVQTELAEVVRGLSASERNSSTGVEPSRVPQLGAGRR